MKKELTRRDILKVAGIGGVSLALAPMLRLDNANAAVAEPKKWNKTADVIVVGGGLAGLTASLSAKKEKVSVILLEKAPAVGGSTVVSGGLLSVGPTSDQKAQGIEDSADNIYNDLMKNNSEDPRMLEPEIIRAYADNCGPVYEWLKGMGGIKLIIPQVGTLGGYDTTRRMMTLDVVKTVAALKENLDKQGIPVVTSSHVQQLVTNKEGKVSGVCAEENGRKVYYKANKGVILTTGCFTASPEMLYKWGGPGLANAMPMGSPTNTGDGMNMALSMGAAARLIYIPAIIEAMGPVDTRVSMPQLPWDGAILVNREGKRFVNESISCTKIGEATVQQPGGYGYIIYDKNIPKAPSQVKLKSHARLNGEVFEAQTLEELEKKTGIPGLAATVKAYNDGIAAGKDPLERTALQGDAGTLVKIETAPFYAIKASGGMYFTSAGIKTNPKAQVLNWYDEVIPRLYVAGQTRGRFAIPYHLGHAMVFGYLAGENAAKERA